MENYSIYFGTYIKMKLTEVVLAFFCLGESQPDSADLFLTTMHIFISSPSFLHSFNASSATTFKSITFSPRTLKSKVKNKIILHFTEKKHNYHVT